MVANWSIKKYLILKRITFWAVLILAGAVGMLVQYTYNFGQDLEGEVKGNEYFILMDGISCTQRIATEKYQRGRGFTITGIKSEEYKLVFSDSSGGYPLEKLHESLDSITLGLISEIGSTDIIFLNTKDGTFSRTYSGDLGGVYAGAAVGGCN